MKKRNTRKFRKKIKMKNKRINQVNNSTRRLDDTIKRIFDEKKYNPQKIREHALKFSKEVFKEKIKEYIVSKIAN
jgi:hypothetical protein